MFKTREKSSFCVLKMTGLEQVFSTLLSSLSSRGLEPEDLFSLADLDEDDIATVSECISILERLSLNLNARDVKVLQGVMSLGGQETISKAEFSGLFREVKRQRSFAKAAPVLPQEPIAKPNKAQPKSGAEAVLAKLITALESQGPEIIEVLDKLEINHKGKVTLSGLSTALANTYPYAASEDLMRLVACLPLDPNYEINAFEAFELLKTYSKSTHYSIKATFRYMTDFILSQNMDINAFFIVNNLRIPLPIDVFVTLLCPIFNIVEDQAIGIFSSLDTHKQGVVDMGDLVTVLESYKTTDKTTFFHVENVQGTESMAENQAKNMQPADFVKILAEFRLVPSQIFQLADSQKLGKVHINDLKRAVLKLIPTISRSNLSDFLSIFPQPDVSLSEFVHFFPPNVNKSQIIHESFEIQIDLKQTDSNGLNIEQVYWVKKLDNTALFNSIALNTLFSAADLNKDDSVTREELAGMMKKCLPHAKLSHKDLAAVMTALDVNGNGKISREEFLKRIVDCRYSEFDRKLLEKYEKEVLNVQESEKKGEGKTNLPVQGSPVKGSALPQRTTLVVDRRIKPLIVKDTTAYTPQLGALYEKLRASMSPYTRSLVLEILPAESMVNIHRFKRLFRVPGGLTDNECEFVFGLTDTHSRDSFYLYQLLTIFDSMDHDFSSMPFPWNEIAERNNRALWSEVAKSIQTKLPLHLAFSTNLKSPLTDSEWRNIMYGAGLPPQHQIMLQETLRRVPGLKVYHIAALLLSYLPDYVLDEEQIMHEGITVLDRSVSESFGRKGYSASDILPKEKLLQEICEVLSLSATEASLVLRLLYTDDQPKPLYTLFTYVDMVQSMYVEGRLVHELPNLPVAQARYQDVVVTELFRTLSYAFKTSITDYGIQPTTELNEVGFVDVVHRATGVAPEELHNAFHLLRFNGSGTVKAYHLLTVMDTYKVQVVAWTYPKLTLNKLYATIPKTQTGITWVKSFATMDLLTPLSLQEIAETFLLNPEDSLALFTYLDSQNRGGVFLYQIAALVDLFIATGANIGSFPFAQNPNTPESIRKTLTTISIHLDEKDKCALGYFQDNGIQPEEACDQKAFARRMGTELTVSESQAVFQSLELRKTGYIRIYHLVACVETYCKRPLDMGLRGL